MAAICELYAGPAGTGKTTALCRWLASQAIQNPDKRFYLIVPEQSAGAYEKKMIRGGLEIGNQPGFFNVDIIGFRRLGYRVFEEAGIAADRVLEEYEKSILIRAAAGEVKKELGLYKNSLDKVGFTMELKSLFSEFMQFGIEHEDMEKAIQRLEKAGDSDERLQKFKDILLIYDRFRSMTVHSQDGSLAEEQGRVLAELLAGNEPLSAVDGAVFVFDDFRGFTPDQFRILQGISRRAERMIFTLTVEPHLLKSGEQVPSYDRFHQSCETWRRLTQHCGDFRITPFERTNETRGYRAPELSHIEEFGFSFPGKTYAGNMTGAFQVWQCENPSDEMRVILEDILDGVKKGSRFRDYAVIAGNAEELHGFAERQFGRYDIPVFMDLMRKGENNPFTDAVLRLLRIAEKDYDYESVFGFLKTGVLRPEEPDDFMVLENEVIRRGIRGRNLWKKEGLFDNEAAERGRKIFMDAVSGGLDDLMAARTASACAEGLLRLIGTPEEMNCGADTAGKNMTGLRLETRIVEMTEDMRRENRLADYLIYEGFYEKLRTVIEKTGRILGAEEMNVAEFGEILSTGIREMRLGTVPPTMDAVLMGDPVRTRPENVETVYIMEMNEGVLPSGRKLQPILNETDRKLLSGELADSGKYLAPDEEMRSAEEMLSLYRMMARPSKRLVLLYALQDRDGTERERSALISRFLRLFPGMMPERKMPAAGYSRRADAPQLSKWLRSEMETGEGENRKQILNYLAGPGEWEKVKSALMPALEYENKGVTLSPEVMRSLPISISVSQMETYAACPYSFYLQYILRLSERREHAFSGLDVGNLLHRTMELSGREIRDVLGNDWKGLTDSALREIAGRNLEKAVREDGRNTEVKPDGKTENALREMRLLAEDSILRVREQITAGEFLPKYFEQSFTATFSVKRPDGSPQEIRINGKIDRVDMVEEADKVYVRIIDYKTGNKTFVPQEVMVGTDIQLPAYSDIVCQILADQFPGKEIVPGGMYYSRLKRPVMKKPGARLTAKLGDEALAAEWELRESLRLDGLINDSPEEAEEDRYKVLRLQDRTAVDPGSGERVSARSLLLDMDKNNELKPDAAVAETQGVRNCMGFGSLRMREITEDILKGSMPKSPVEFEKSEKHMPCKYCKFRSVCRRPDSGENSDPKRQIAVPVGTVRDQLDLMMPLSQTEFRQRRFYEED